MIAAVNGDAELIVESLLARADLEVDAQDDMNRTALYLAVHNNRVGALRAMLAHGGADLNAADHKGVTPLMSACVEHRTDIFKMLLDEPQRRVDVNQRDSYDDNVLSYAARHGFADIVRLLFADDRTDIASADAEGLTAFMFACSRGEARIVDLFLADERARATCNMVDENGSTAFLLACRYDHPDVVKRLMEDSNGAVDPTILDASGWTGLHHAASEGHTRVIAVLLRYTDRLDPNAVDLEGRSAFMYACRKGNNAAIALMLQNPAVDPDVRANRRSATAFLLACEAEKYMAVRQLLESDNVDCHAADIDGMTAFQIAAQAGKWTLLDVLLESREGQKMADAKYTVGTNTGRSVFGGACFEGKIDLVKYLAEDPRKVANLDAVDKAKRTGFQNACVVGKASVVSYFLSSQAAAERIDFNAKDKDGKTGLLLAVQMNRLDIVRLLVEAKEKVDLIVPDSKGRTALDWAVWEKRTEMEELLRPPALDPEPEPEPEAPVLPEPEAEAGSSDGTASEARKRAAEGDRRTPAKRRRIGIGDLDEDREADQLALVLAGPAGEAVKDEPEEQVASPQLKVFYGPPGTGKTRKLLELMRDYSDHYEFVTFHPSFSYEDFIVGLRPVLFENPDGSTSSHFEMTPGVFMRLCERARRDKRNRYALFVDEINRANVGKVFGEVLTLIEPDKRGVGIRLPGCSGSFSVPPNVDLFGSMNSTDRSIALLDIALRRRFAFVEIRPDESLLPREVDGIDLSRVLRALNDRVEFFLDRDHAIGHSYFPGVESLDDLRAAFKDKIIPLLREYFFDDTGKVAAVLHTAGSPPFVRTTSVRPADLFPARGGPLPAAARGGTFGPARDVEKHSMTDADVWTADTFRGLYE